MASSAARSGRRTPRPTSAGGSSSTRRPSRSCARYLQHRAQQAALLGIELGEDASSSRRAPDGATPVRPDTVTQRYSRMCARLGWDMHIHQLRHFSATELIAAGVDVRTVAGRLGHGGGGTTTLRVYSAWVAEADQRAAGALASRTTRAALTTDDFAGVDRRCRSQLPRTEEKTGPYRADRRRPSGRDPLWCLRARRPPPQRGIAGRQIRSRRGHGAPGARASERGSAR